jgi:hypothetical protein
MHCPSCDFANPEGMKFCNECGVPLQNRCAKCRFENSPQAKFVENVVRRLRGSPKSKV